MRQENSRVCVTLVALLRRVGLVRLRTLLATLGFPAMSAAGDPAMAALRDLGYAYVPGASGAQSDWILRQTEDPTKGFEWRGQADYDAVGAAAVEWVRSRLTMLCGLEEVSTGIEPATAYCTPGWRNHSGPSLLLVCGSAPGGTAGLWGRSLCINASTHEGTPPSHTPVTCGTRRACACVYTTHVWPPDCTCAGAMFDYITRGKSRGWSVIVADPHGEEAPHRHLQLLFREWYSVSALLCY